MEIGQVDAQPFTASEGKERGRISRDEFLQKEGLEDLQQQQKLEVDSGD
jgi:hypothetical protein